jgi:4'-phosphopantetheinyl transferase
LSVENRLNVYWTLAEAVPGWDSPASLDWLSEVERHRLEALVFPKRRSEWLLGRLTAKKLLLDGLTSLADPAPSRLEVGNEPEGAPYALLDGSRLDICLSISHRDRLALCALCEGSGSSIGADIEKIERRVEAFAGDYFTPHEQDLLARTTGVGRDRLVTLIWSAKEAALKALRKGLRLDTRSVEVHDLERTGEGWGSFRLSGVHPEDYAWRGWWQVTGEYVLTMALLGGAEAVKKATLVQIE